MRHASPACLFSLTTCHLPWACLLSSPRASTVPRHDLACLLQRLFHLPGISVHHPTHFSFSPTKTQRTSQGTPAHAFLHGRTHYYAQLSLLICVPILPTRLCALRSGPRHAIFSVSATGYTESELKHCLQLEPR